MNRIIWRGPAWLAALIIGAAVMACGFGASGNDDPFTELPLNRQQLEAMEALTVPGSANFDPTIKAIYDAGYRPKRLSKPDPERTIVGWDVLFCGEKVPYSRCEGDNPKSPRIRAILDGEPKDNVFVFSTNPLLTPQFFSKTQDCWMMGQQITGPALAGLPDAIAGYKKRGVRPVTVAGVTFSCWYKDPKKK